MIFKEWSLFWEQYRREKRIYYTGDQLLEKWEFLRKVRPDLHAKYLISPWQEEADRIKAGLNKDMDDDELHMIKDVLACEVELVAEFNLKVKPYFRLYQNDPIYLFPSWIRKPFSECPTCMASVYGSIIYWFVVLNGPSGFFVWAVKENLAKFGFWVIFCLILACGNKYLEQKLKL